MNVFMCKFPRLLPLLYAITSVFLFVYFKDDAFTAIFVAAVSISSLSRGNLLNNTLNIKDTVIFFISSTYLTLALFGYQLILDNDTEKGFMFGIALTMGIFWIFNGIRMAFLLLSYFSEKKYNLNSSYYWGKWLLIFSIICAMLAVYQIVYNPIAMSHDSWSYLRGWQDGTYYSVRAPLYALFILVVCSIAPTTPEVMWIAITQLLAFSAILTTWLCYLHKKGIPFVYVIFFAILLGFLPNIGLHTIVIWADTPFAISMLWLLYVLARIIDELIFGQDASKAQIYSLCAQLCLSLIFICFFRSNSFPVYFVMVIALAILFIVKKKRAPLIAVITSLVLTVIMYVPIYNTLGVISDENARQMKYYALMNDILGAYYEGGNFSEESFITLSRSVPNLNEAATKEEYTVVLPHSAHFDFYQLDNKAFAKLYIDFFLRNPVNMTKNMLIRMQSYWVVPAQRRVQTLYYTNIYDRPSGTIGESPSLGVYRSQNSITPLMEDFIDTLLDPLSLTITGWFGLWVALKLIIGLYVAMKKSPIYLILFLPELVYVATLFIGAGWNDYRYGLCLFLNALFLPGFIVLCKSKTLVNEELSNDNNC